MSRRSKETLAVQLFPFLAVLVCTMGSLIFLLLVTTREIRQRAVAFAAFQQRESENAASNEIAVSEVPRLPLVSILNPQPPVVDPQYEPEPEQLILEDDGYEEALAQREREISELKATWRLRANQLANERNHQKELLARRKSLLQGAATKTDSLQSEIQQLEVQLGVLAGETAVVMTKEEEAEYLLLEQQIAAMKKRLRAAQVADATTPSDQFQVIPFDPQTGTNRRPILIECTAAGIRFIPEDILITAKDMEGFTHKVNPLAAGTGALINYWTVWNMKQRQPQSEPEPYVLMLVRPDGVYAYYVALKMLDPIRTAQGYELIEDSTALKLPEVDLGAKTACQTAVNRLLSERENIYRSAVRNGSAETVFGGGGNAGSLRKGGPPGSSPGPERRGGRAADGIGARGEGGNTFTMNVITGGDNAVGTRSWERIENFQGRPRGPRTSGVATGPAAGTATGAVGGAGGGAVDQGVPEPLNRVFSDQGMAPDELVGSDWAGESETPDPSQPPNGRRGTKGASGKQGPSNANASSSNGLTANGPNGNGSSGNGGTFDFPESGAEHEPGMPIGERPGRKPKPLKSPNQLAEQGEAEPESEWNDEGPPPEDGGTGGPGRTRSGDSSSSSRLSDGMSAAQRYTHDPRSSTRAPRPGEKPKRSDDADKPLEPEMLAGRRWGQCDPGASIGFEREVRVDVTENKLVIAEKHAVPIGQGESKAETLERFAKALDLCSREWGRPPQGFFWAPRLKFVVKPEANGAYEQVNAMMTRAGLATSHEFAKNATAIQFGKATPATTRPAPKTASPRTGGAQ